MLLLKFALNNNAPETVKENGKDVTVLTVTLAADIIGVSEIPQTTQSVNRVVYDLNGHKLTTAQTDNFSVTDDVVFQNGSLEFSKVMLDEGTPSMAKVSISVGAHGKLTLDNVKLTTAGSGLLMSTNQYPEPDGDTTDNYLTIKDSTLVIKGHYGVGTNATNSANIRGAVGLVIDNSTITMNPDEYGVGGKGDVKDNCALFINVPSHVTVTGSTLTANRQAVIVRGGTLQMSDTTLNLVEGYMTENNQDEEQAYVSGNWGTGCKLPHAVMTIGHDGDESAYQYKTTVTLSDVVFNAYTGATKVFVASDFADDTLEDVYNDENNLEGEDEVESVDEIPADEMPIMVYLNANNLLTGSDIDFVTDWDDGTIQLVNCNDVTGIY